MPKLFREYATITREQAFARGFDLKWLHTSYDYGVARKTMEEFPYIQTMYFARPEHNTCRSRYAVGPGEAVYVKSKHGGKWGKSARLRVGKEEAKVGTGAV